MSTKLNMQFTFNYTYKLIADDNIIGIKSNSGSGKTKMAQDIEDASLDGNKAFDGRQVISLRGARDLPLLLNQNLTSNHIIILDNLEMYPNKVINQIRDLINKFPDAVWIQIGHSNWIVKHFNAIKKINVDHDNRVVTLEGIV